MFLRILQILSMGTAQARSLPGSQTSSSSSSAPGNERARIFRDHLEERFPRFPVGLDGNSMKELEAQLLGGEGGNVQVLNLYGLPGSGKTTMARKLCRDLQVQLQGKFKECIFETLGSQITRDEATQKLVDKLCKDEEEKPVLLVLDDVWPRPEIIDMINGLKLPQGSRTLVTSRVQIMTAPPTKYLKMEPLSPEDAEKLFLHLIQPTQIDFKDEGRHKILIKVVEGCKGLPLALEFLGRQLQGKPIEAFQKLLYDWSQSKSILDSHADLLARLQNSVDESIAEHFMDLGLFPEDQKIPITALIDMWIELFNLEEPKSLTAMLMITELIEKNLAARIKVRRIIGRDDLDNYCNNSFLMQSALFRELAIYMSNQGPWDERQRLIIEMYGNPNNPPNWWPNQQPRVVVPPILSISTDKKITPDWCNNIQAAGTVVLVLNLMTEDYTLPEFMKEMEKLKVLIVTNYGSCKTELRNPELLGYLMSLKRIRLQQVSVPCLLCELKNVRKLSLYLCKVKNAFENSSIEFSEAMPELEDLSIEYCEDLVKLPTGLFNIITMKNLTISSCHKFICLPEEIGKLENLELLRINDCADFEEMPDSITKLKNLSLLDISFCVSLEKLPEKIGELQNLNKLYMTDCKISELPDSVKDLTILENVICDEYAYPLWEVTKFSLPKLKIKKAGKDVSLNWLS